MEAFYHHSRRLRFRDPQGAAPCGARVTIAAEVAGDFERAEIFLRLWRDGAGETLLPMRVENGRAEVAFDLPEATGLIWYFFILRCPDGSTRYYGGRSGAGAFSDHEPPAWRIAVYERGFETPAWYREGVCYQIFPDRFKRSSWEDFHHRANAHLALSQRLRLHERWSEEPEIAPGPGETCYEPDDFFGGDLNGIREKLGYLQSLGVTTLYLNPIFASPSNHRYNTSDYLHVDPLLGTDEDFQALAAEARERGIRILLDGVFSHTGADSVYFNRFGHYGPGGAAQDATSPYYEWYTFYEYPDKYDCWWNFPSLPNVRELTPSYLDFIAGEDGVLAHWIKMGASGWRLDVADELPDEFIELLRRRLKAVDPEAVLMGEVWEDPTDKRGPDGARRTYADGRGLDCTMNYPFTDAVIAFLTGKDDAYAFSDALAFLREQYPKPFYDAALNLLSSHDVVRAVTALSGAPARTQITREQQARYTPPPEAARRGRERLILATAVQAALPGVPCVYYGDEAGLTGMADPFNRRTFPWGREDTALTKRIQEILTMRRESAALRRGRCRMGALSKDVFALIRYTDEGDAAVLLVNRSEALARVTLAPDMLPEGPDGETPVALAGTFLNQFGAETALPETWDMELAPLSATLWRRTADAASR